MDRQPSVGDIVVGGLACSARRAAKRLVATHFGPPGVRAFEFCYRTYPWFTVCGTSRGTLLGVCFAYPHPGDSNVLVLDGIAVASVYARRGLGSRLVDAVEECGRSRGCRRIVLYATVGTEPFYVRLGYARVDLHDRQGDRLEGKGTDRAGRCGSLAWTALGESGETPSDSRLVTALAKELS